jgi:hypothetical protein
MERLVDTQAIRCDSLQLQVGQRESTKAQSQELGLRTNLSPFVQKVYTIWAEFSVAGGHPDRSGDFLLRLSSAADRTPDCASPQADYLAGREPVMRMSTSLLALCCQSGLVATLATPISARSRSIGSRSLRMSPLFIARFTSARIASHICA